MSTPRLNDAGLDAAGGEYAYGLDGWEPVTPAEPRQPDGPELHPGTPEYAAGLAEYLQTAGPEAGG